MYSKLSTYASTCWENKCKNKICWYGKKGGKENIELPAKNVPLLKWRDVDEAVWFDSNYYIQHHLFSHKYCWSARSGPQVAKQQSLSLELMFLQVDFSVSKQRTCLYQGISSPLEQRICLPQGDLCSLGRRQDPLLKHWLQADLVWPTCWTVWSVHLSVNRLSYLEVHKVHTECQYMFTCS